ncbi:undecaprenyl diphosphate synthase family protein, partial [Candidatus Falkowbacteria bacterium]|nr:undecaprenyl diphosphate synthase family protein [Candidatus Falkowbacteria bacterium]
MNQIPQHIAFIMDGNRRWAVENGLPKMEGHTKGLENFKVIVDYCREIGVKYTTFWALSTDNLKKREDLELQHLFKLLGD